MAKKATSSGVKFIVGRPRGSQSTEVESVLFDRAVWTKDAARAWLKREGFKVSGLEPGGPRAKDWHFRQRDPEEFTRGSLRTIAAGKNNDGAARVKNPGFAGISDESVIVWPGLKPEAATELVSLAKEFGALKAQRLANSRTSFLSKVRTVWRGRNIVETQEIFKRFVTSPEYLTWKSLWGVSPIPSPYAGSREYTTETKRNPGGGRRNPSIEPAENLYEQFHGRAPHRIRDVYIPDSAPSELAQLGRLTRISVSGSGRLVTRVDFREEDRVSLAAAPDSRSLYIVGGNQKMPADFFQQLDAEQDKDLIVLGTAKEIRYLTRKGFDKFEEIEYYHELGEETGERPLLLYDRRGECFLLAGGAYDVRPEGITN